MKNLCKCGKEIDFFGRSIHCKSCAKKGELNSNFKNDKTHNNKCEDCGKLIYWGSIRCRLCSDKNRIKRRLVCKECNKLISRHNKSGLCRKCIKKYVYVTKNDKVIHHIDGNHENNKNFNLLKMLFGEHKSLHLRGYHYLVKIGLVYDYLRDFCLKYKIVDTKDKIDGKVVHHVDCNRENNDESNFMYLKDKKIHNKLHQETYKYLVRINKVNDYISWFFLQKKNNHQSTDTMKSEKSHNSLGGYKHDSCETCTAKNFST